MFSCWLRRPRLYPVNTALAYNLPWRGFDDTLRTAFGGSAGAAGAALGAFSLGALVLGAFALGAVDGAASAIPKTPK